MKKKKTLKKKSRKKEQHQVLVYLQFKKFHLDNERALDAVFELDDILREMVELKNVGDYDGHEFCESPDEESVTFFMYGPDADEIYQAILPVLLHLPKLPGSYVIKRYGDVGAKEKQIFLT